MNYPTMKVAELRRLVRKRGIASGLAVAGARKNTLIQALTLDRWPSKVQSGASSDDNLVSAYLESLELAKSGEKSDRLYLLQGRIISALAGIEGGSHD